MGLGTQYWSNRPQSHSEWLQTPYNSKGVHYNVIWSQCFCFNTTVHLLTNNSNASRGCCFTGKWSETFVSTALLEFTISSAWILYWLQICTSEHWVCQGHKSPTPAVNAILEVSVAGKSTVTYSHFKHVRLTYRLKESLHIAQDSDKLLKNVIAVKHILLSKICKNNMWKCAFTCPWSFNFR